MASLDSSLTGYAVANETHSVPSAKRSTLKKKLRCLCILLPISIIVSVGLGVVAGWCLALQFGFEVVVIEDDSIDFSHVNMGQVAPEFGGDENYDVQGKQNRPIPEQYSQFEQRKQEKPKNADDSFQSDLVKQRLLAGISANSIEANLRSITSIPRVAGTDHNRQIASSVEQQWRHQGLDSATTETYDVLLSYPAVKVNPNKVEILHSDGSVKYESPIYERILDPDQNKNLGLPPYMAYAKPGTVEGDVVYVNYGSETDVLFIQKHYNISIEGKIVMARYWGNTMKEKIEVAVKYGALGLIMFPDPLEEAPYGPDKVFPERWWLPESAVIRIPNRVNFGDPLTPGYPAKAFASRQSIEEFRKLQSSSIPVHPVGYETARHIFKAMDPESPGRPTDYRWKSSPKYILKKNLYNDFEDEYNFFPKIGGQMRDGQKVVLSVNNTLEMRKVYNVIGTIRGSTEPDRLVIVGNHRDSWVYGAVDPGGGTAVMMELSRVLGAMVKEGWRPKRTIMFCSWDAEEFGLIGSTEWVEDKLKILQHKAVSYINVDVVVSGTSLLHAEASALLDTLIFDVAREVPHPTFPTLFNAWLNESVTHTKNIPSINKLAASSDFVPFFFMAGIPSTNIYYKDANVQSAYPTYHTAYDTFHYVKKFIDPNFVYHRTMAQFFMELIRRLSTDVIIPFNPLGYAKEMAESSLMNVNSWMKWFDGEGKDLLDHYRYSVQNFSAAAHAFSEDLKTQDLSNPYVARMMNDKLMMVEQAFIDENWGQGSYINHVLASMNMNSPTQNDGVLSVLLEDDIKQYVMNVNATMPPHLYEKIKKQFVIVCFAIDTATQVLVM